MDNERGEPTPPRPRVVFFVGNGLSIRLCKYLSFDNIDLVSLVQPQVLYDFADADPTLAGCSLWDKRLFPHLCSVPPERLTGGSTFHEGVRHVLELDDGKPLTYGRGNGSLSFSGAMFPHDLELRCYLWLLFESIDRRFVSELRRRESGERFLRWPWRHFMQWLSATAPTTFVSFNYECLLETTLASGGAISVLCDPSMVSRHEFPQQTRTCHVWKPHGCVSFYMPKGFYYGPRPWRELPGRNVIVHNVQYSTASAVTRIHPPRKMPPLPDIVPPGARHTVIGDTMDYAKEVQRVAKSGSVFVFVGVSGRSPDDEEIGYMLREIDRNAPVLHAGIGQDINSPLARLLRDTSSSYRYFPLDDERQEREFFRAVASECLSPDEVDQLRRQSHFRWRLVV